MNAVCVIPARLNSYRFQGKSLRLIHGLPMIEHVYRRAKLATLLDEVYVTTPDQEIIETVQAFGGACLPTTDDVRRASDRVAQAAMNMDYDIIVNLQGDEPLVMPEMLDQAVSVAMDDPTLQCVNVVYHADHESARDENEVKVVTDSDDFMMYASREPIPARWLGDKQFLHKIWVGITVFTRDSLKLYASLPSTPLEIIESIDMLRFLEHKVLIKVLTDSQKTQSVDAPEDIAKVEALMLKDAHFPTYSSVATQ